RPAGGGGGAVIQTANTRSANARGRPPRTPATTGAGDDVTAARLIGPDRARPRHGTRAALNVHCISAGAGGPSPRRPGRAVCARRRGRPGRATGGLTGLWADRALRV